VLFLFKSIKYISAAPLLIGRQISNDFPEWCLARVSVDDCEGRANVGGRRRGQDENALGRHHVKGSTEKSARRVRIGADAVQVNNAIFAGGNTIEFNVG